MKIKVFLFGIAFALVSNFAWAGCSFTNVTEVRSLTNSFDAWKAVTEAMSECGNVTATLDSEFKDKQPDAFAANPSLYEIGGVSGSTITPLLNAGTIRPLDDLVAKYGQNLNPNQLIKIDVKLWASLCLSTISILCTGKIFLMT